MTVIDFLLLLLVAGVCGAMAQAISGYARGICLVTIAWGFIGALLGTWLARVSGLPDVLSIHVGGQTFPVVWSIMGGALFAVPWSPPPKPPGPSYANWQLRPIRLHQKGQS